MPLNDDERCAARISSSQWAEAALRLDAELAEVTKQLETAQRIERERWEKAAKTFGIPDSKEVPHE